MKRSVLRRLPWEAFVWLGGLLAMALYQPTGDRHFSLCPLQNLGFDFCPGCGLGRSVSFFFHGEFMHSLSAHPLGIFAVIVLSYRIVQLTRPHILNLWQKLLM
ncbi:MAG TPA: DUF2752 domain-containing protein [Cyclobacteriaceae bacterium]|jgi:hypothetical protein